MSSYILPWVHAKDPSVCVADGKCIADCASPDPDCTPKPVDDGEDMNDGDQPGEDEGDGGGCNAGATPGAWSLVGLALVGLLRKRRRR